MSQQILTNSWILTSQTISASRYGAATLDMVPLLRMWCLLRGYGPPHTLADMVSLSLTETVSFSRIWTPSHKLYSLNYFLLQEDFLLDATAYIGNTVTTVPFQKNFHIIQSLKEPLLHENPGNMRNVRSFKITLDQNFVLVYTRGPNSLAGRIFDCGFNSSGVQIPARKPLVVPEGHYHFCIPVRKCIPVTYSFNLLSFWSTTTYARITPIVTGWDQTGSCEQQPLVNAGVVSTIQIHS